MPDPNFHVVYAHPYPSRSVAVRALLEVFLRREDVTLRSLYDLYPDCNIDVQSEQRAMQAAPNIVWLAPTYWYSVPSLMKLWFEMVLTRGWAFGPEGTALRGKRCLWVTTTGGSEFDYSQDGFHQRPFAEFVAPVEQTARYCGMDWQAPFVLHGANRLDAEKRSKACMALGERIEQLIAPGVRT